MNEKNKLQECKENYESVSMSDAQLEKMKERILEAKAENRRGNKTMRKLKKAVIPVVAAAAVAFVVLPNTSAGVADAMGKIPVLGNLADVVTFRDYNYADDRNVAEIKVPAVTIRPENNTDSKKAQNLKESVDSINKEVRKIVDTFIDDFEKNLSEDGYQDVHVDYEVVNTTKDYFTLKIDSFEASGSGSEWNNYYTIDLKTGKRLQLKDLFVKGADYITPVTNNIKEQMKQQMAENKDVIYWLDGEVKEWDFKNITDKTQFYVNDKGNLVISFDEGDVAPMYMGVVTFEIPNDVLKDIRK